MNFTRLFCLLYIDTKYKYEKNFLIDNDYLYYTYTMLRLLLIRSASTL